MTFLFSRARRLFDYGDLNGDSASTSFRQDSPSSGSTSVSIETLGGIGADSANARLKKRRKLTLVAVCVFVVAAVIIVAVSVQHKDDGPVRRRLPDAFSSATSAKRGENRNIEDESRVRECDI
jgi:hypothetical protein